MVPGSRLDLFYQVLTPRISTTSGGERLGSRDGGNHCELIIDLLHFSAKKGGGFIEVRRMDGVYPDVPCTS